MRLLRRLTLPGRLAPASVVTQAGAREESPSCGIGHSPAGGRHARDWSGRAVTAGSADDRGPEPDQRMTVIQSRGLRKIAVPPPCLAYRRLNVRSPAPAE